ncbi:MAG TPA: TRAP transporter small permease [Firmicutes bacterium]|nr:TRAP transporter small permease [Bacillota bacterium]
MSKIAGVIRSIANYWNRFAVTFSCILIALAMLIVTAEVIARKFFSYSIRFVMQFGGYTLFISAFICAAWVLQEKSHLRVTFVIDYLKNRPRAIHELILKILGCVLCIILLYITSYYLIDNIIATGITTEYPLRFPLAIIYTWMPLGWLFMILEYVLQIREDIKSLKKPGQKTSFLS